MVIQADSDLPQRPVDVEANRNRVRRAALWLIEIIQRDWLALLLYTAAAILLTYPLARHLTDNWMVATEDLAMKIWDVWWFDRVVSEGQSLFYTPYMYYPLGLDLSFYPMSWTATPFIWALSKLFGVFPAYKIQILAGLVLTGYSAYLLIVYLTHNRVAAWAGGAIYAFAPYHVVHTIEHPDLALIGTIPLMVLFFLISIEEDAIWAAVVAGVMLGLTAWTGVYLLGFAGLTIGPVLLFVMLHRSRWRKRQLWLMIGTFAICGGILAAGRMWPILTNSLDLGSAAEQKGDLNKDNISPIFYLVPPPRNPISTLLHDPLELTENQYHLESGKPPYLGLVPLVLVMVGLFTPGEKRGMPAWLWVIMAAMFILMTLGPRLRGLDGLQTDIWLPASLIYDWFPLVKGVRPHYFHLGTLLPLAVLSSYGLSRLQEKLHEKPRPANAIAILAIAFLLCEYWGDFYNEELAHSEDLRPSDFYEEIAHQDEYFALLDLPIEHRAGKWQIYYQSFHGHPIGGGMTGRYSGDPERYLRQNYAVNRWMEKEPCRPEDYIPVQEAIDDLIADGFRYLIIQKAWMGGNYIASYLGETVLFGDEDIRVYELSNRDLIGVCGGGTKPLWPPEDGGAVQSIPDLDGRLACGIFAGGHGYKEIVAASFTECSNANGELLAPVSIECLNGDGVWNDENVHNLDINQQRTALSFDLNQDGICGLFLDGTSSAP